MIREDAPKFIKLLVAAGCANEIDREDSVVDIELTRVPNKTDEMKHIEGLRLQLWFNEGGFACCLESIDSAGSPHYFQIFRSADEAQFKADLLRLFEHGSSELAANIREILRMNDADAPKPIAAKAELIGIGANFVNPIYVTRLEAASKQMNTQGYQQKSGFNIHFSDGQPPFFATREECQLLIDRMKPEEKKEPRETLSIGVPR